ncbi:unnamed protein product [Durusdinium trenchii]|uniref:Uncharacterized protein n=1 Tax=Durusdinium trenchii TaxID=1381693 RepID=A0ABP0MRL6_9DINO
MVPSEDVEGVPDTVENHHDDPVAQEWEIAVATGFHMFFELETGGLEDEDEILAALRQEEITERVGKILSRMTPCGVDILRGTKAYQVLQGFGSPLRHPSPSLHAKSYPTEKIQTFCSHSWQGWWLAKYLTLLLFYNGTAAAVVSSIGAAIAAGLFCFDVLPILKAEDSQYWSSFWAVIVGGLLYVITLLFWRRSSSLFLDTICIDQVDPARKSKGLFSMGAFLKSSNSMLVLWDASYCSRLWCMFEVAGFLRSRPDSEKPRLIMRPTILGPCYILQTFTVFIVFVSVGLVPDHTPWVFFAFQALVCFCGFYINVAAYRNYFSSIEKMQAELCGFALQNTASDCCSREHKLPNGDKMICDRDCICKCISAWFGRLDNFENRVRTEVLSCLTEQLTTQFFTYRQCVTTMVPILWSFMDTGSAHVRLSQKPDHLPWLMGAREMARGFAWWLGVAPVALLAGFRISFYLRRRWNCGRCDFWLNVPPLLAVVVVVAIMVQLEQLCFGAFRAKSEFLVNMLVFAAVVLPLAALLFGCVGAHPGMNRKKAEIRYSPRSPSS